MAIQYDNYNPLVHKKVKEELASVQRTLTGLEMIKESITGDEIDEHTRYVRVLKNDEKALLEKLQSFDEHIKRRNIRATLLDKAQQALNNKQL